MPLSGLPLRVPGSTTSGRIPSPGSRRLSGSWHWFICGYNQWFICGYNMVFANTASTSAFCVSRPVAKVSFLEKWISEFILF